MKALNLTLGMSVVLVSSCQSKPAENEKPNILFIMTDDHALSAISAYNGYLAKVAPTPNIDRIANEGVLFNNFYCTNSISGPSRASILTENTAMSTGSTRMRMAETSTGLSRFTSVS